MDRPGLDALRDAAEAGQFDAVWCLSPDRLARKYAYQVIVIDELARHATTVLFHDTPPLDNDPQMHLLMQVQGVIAEYERAKIAERYRRGKLWPARAGEVIAWKCAYGYRRVARLGEQPAHLELYEPEAAIVRRIFRNYVQGNLSMRQITWQLNQENVPSPSGKAIWGVSTIGRLLLRLLLEEDCVPSFDAVRELAGQAKPAAVPLIGPARIDLTGYDALLASSSAHA